MILQLAGKDIGLRSFSLEDLSILAKGRDFDVIQALLAEIVLDNFIGATTLACVVENFYVALLRLDVEHI